MLYLVVDGHDAGSGRAAREEHLINKYPNPSVLHTNAGLTRSPRKFLESRQFYCTAAHGLRTCADTGSIRPPSLHGTEVTLQAAGEARQRGRVGLCQRHFLLLYLPIIEFEVRALRAQ